MGAQRARPLVLDAGALIAIDRADRRVVRLLELAEDVHVPAVALAQAWRNPARQVRLARVLAADGVEVHPLDLIEAKSVGQLCGATRSADVIDASSVLLARRLGGVAVTSDGDDLRAIDPNIALALC